MLAPVTVLWLLALGNAGGKVMGSNPIGVQWDFSDLVDLYPVSGPL